MIKCISTKIVELWSRNRIIDVTDKESYGYGMELILSTLLNIMLMMILSFILIKHPIAFLPYMIVYIPLRLFAGGYHADRHWKCILYTQSTFVGWVMFINIMARYNAWYILVELMLAGLIIVVMAPVEASNKPLNEKERRKQKYITWFIQGVVLMAVLLFVLLGYLENTIVLCGIAANISVAFSLLLAKIRE